MGGFKTKILSGVLPFSLACLLSWAGSAQAITPVNTNISNTAAATWGDTNSNGYTGSSNTVSVTVALVTGVSVSCATGDQPTPSNVEVNYTCTATNTGNDNNTFALSVIPGTAAPANVLAAWATTLVFDTDGDGARTVLENAATATTGVLASGAVYHFFVVVKPTANTPNATTSQFTLTATDGGSASQSFQRTTTAQAPSLTLLKQVHNATTSSPWVTLPTTTAKPGETLEYQVKVVNSGTLQANAVVLSDNLDANVTFVAGSLWVGPDGTAHNGGANVIKTDAAAGDAVCAVDTCGAASYTAGTPNKVTFFLGNGATEVAGGTLNTGAPSTVYVYYSATVK